MAPSIATPGPETEKHALENQQLGQEQQAGSLPVDSDNKAEVTTTTPSPTPAIQDVETKQQPDPEQPIHRIVEFSPGDPTNPMNFSPTKKWFITFIVTTSILAITLTSSAYSSSGSVVISEFNTSTEVFALGISLFVLGFAVGPALWAPLSELYGRRILFVVTHGLVVAFVAASAGANSMASLLVFRFLAGTFGASPMTNSGGVIADLFPPAQRGLAITLFAFAPFMGPVLGPVIGGFITMTIGWRWVHGVCSIFIGVVWIAGTVWVPETYGPVLLRRRAEALERETGLPHRSVLHSGGATPGEVFARALKRPWVLLFLEPIVLIASTYLAILYGTIYMFFGAFPIVYQEMRGWSVGVGGLAFLGLAVGMLLGLVYTLVDNGRYQKLLALDRATPESRLPPATLGAVALPVGMFAFAWTNGPSIHWAASIVLSAPFGFGCVLVFLSCLNYLLDAYTIYAASVLAAGAILRSFFAAAFPLFVTQMYKNLGIHWASSIPAFLTVACMPFPFLLYRYGAAIRMKCKYAHEAAMLLAKMRGAEAAKGGGATGGVTSAESTEEEPLPV